MYYTLGGKNARRISNSLLLTIAPEDGTEISAGFPGLELLSLEEKRLFRLDRSCAHNSLHDSLDRTSPLFFRSTN